MNVRSRGGARIFSPLKRGVLLVVLVMLVALIVYGQKVINENDAMSMKKTLEVEDLKSDIKIQDDKEEELNKTKDKDTTKEDYEEIARSELGLIKKDEIVIKPK